MSKRGQESTAKEGSAVAKPRQMTLVSRKLLSTKQTSPKDSGASNSPVNQELDQSSVSWSARKQVRDNDQDPTTHAQEWQKDNNPFWGTRKLVRSGECASSMQISDHRYLEKVFEKPAAKVESRRRGTSTRLEDQCIDLGIIYVDNDESLCFLDQNFHITQ